MRLRDTGLLQFDEARATPGFTLFTPIMRTTTYLIDLSGEEVHRWELPSDPGNYVYLLPNGNLFGALRTAEGPKGLSAKGGRIVEMDWDGDVVWEFFDHFQYHDFRRLANGNTIYIAWELLSPEQAARVQGGRPGSGHEDGIYGDCIREVNSDGELVWEWHIDGNQDIERYPICPICPRFEFAHANAVCPTLDGDVMVSWRDNHLIAVIDRETKKLKWEMCDAELGHQHDFQCLENGNYLVFANGDHAFGPDLPRGGPPGSRVLEIAPASKEIVWQYGGKPRHEFFSHLISGAQRLASGNTLIPTD